MKSLSVQLTDERTHRASAIPFGGRIARVIDNINVVPAPPVSVSAPARH